MLWPISTTMRPERGFGLGMAHHEERMASGGYGYHAGRRRYTLRGRTPTGAASDQCPRIGEALPIGSERRDCGKFPGTREFARSGTGFYGHFLYKTNT